jgi:hypothetical protein
MKTEASWIPLIDDERSTEAAVYGAGGQVDNQDGVVTRKISKKEKNLPLIYVAIFDCKDPESVHTPKQAFWIPVTEKAGELVFHFRYQDILKNEHKGANEEHIFFVSDDGMIKTLFDKSDQEQNWRKIAELRRSKLDSSFVAAVSRLLKYRENKQV